VRYEAIGSKSSEQIIVYVSPEVLDEYGEYAAKQKGSEKYDNNDYTGNIVYVRTSDFQ
jgi:predicted nucleic acid-binding protein